MIKLDRICTMKVPNSRSETRDEHGNYLPATVSDKNILFHLLEREQDVATYQEGARIGNNLRIVIRYDKELISGNASIDDYRIVYNEVLYSIISVQEYLKEGKYRWLELYLAKEI